MSLHWRQFTHWSCCRTSQWSDKWIHSVEWANPIQLSCCSRQAGGLPFSPQQAEHSQPSVTVSFAHSGSLRVDRLGRGGGGTAQVQLHTPPRWLQRSVCTPAGPAGELPTHHILEPWVLSRFNVCQHLLMLSATQAPSSGNCLKGPTSLSGGHCKYLPPICDLSFLFVYGDSPYFYVTYLFADFERNTCWENFWKYKC